MASSACSSTGSTSTPNPAGARPEEVLPGYSSVSDFCQVALQTVCQATKQSIELPRIGDDYEYYDSFKGFHRIMRSEQFKILQTMSSIINHQGIRDEFEGFDSEEKADFLSDTNDKIMENIANAIDEATGVRKKCGLLVISTLVSPQNIKTSWNKKSTTESPAANVQLLSARNIQRPQLQFRDKIDNTSSPFLPIIKDKPNALKPLELVLEEIDDGFVYNHPYQHELLHFKVPSEHVERATKQTPPDVESTPLIFVKKSDQIPDLLNDLKNQTEISIDLEHHSYRSFQGFTCLMQLSTRTTDYIIDTLSLRSDLQPLNEVFTDPNVLKVLHGADSDVEWLQRDLGLYLVNMFDTGQASRVLQMAHFSLAHLLFHYFNIKVDKKYQLADWRIRPLPDVLVNYAREDTHYLLHLYDRMKNELLDKGNKEKNLLESVFLRSKFICEKCYCKPAFNPKGYMDLCKKTNRSFNSRQLYALEELYKWRDDMARTEDESLGFVLPVHMMLAIAEHLPKEVQGIIALCNPVPPLVKHQLKELHSIVLKARTQPVAKHHKLQETPELDRKINRSLYQDKLDLDNPLNCRHDMSHDSYPMGLHMNSTEDCSQVDAAVVATSSRLFLEPDNTVVVKKRAAVSLFNEPDTERNETSNNSVLHEVEQKLKQILTPFKRYLLVRPLAQDKNSCEEPDFVPESTDHKERVFQHLQKLLPDNSTSPSQSSSSKVQELQASEIDEKKSKIEKTIIVDDDDVEVIEPIRNKMSGKRKKMKKKNIKHSLESSEPDIVHGNAKPDGNKNKFPSKKQKTQAGAERTTIPNSFVPFNYNEVNYEKLKDNIKSLPQGGKKKKQKKNFFNDIPI